jgi:putative endonuclease
MAINGQKRKVGFWGERKAAEYLKRNGYKILERNFKCPVGEADIIAKKDDVIAFIEVKTRTSTAFGLPNEAVDATRRWRYIQVAKYYFSGKIIEFTVRFDIIEILNGNVNHIQSAFEA